MSAARWCTVAPLFYRGRKDLEVPFDLGHGLVLNQVPAWVRGKDIAGQVSGGLRDSLSDVIRYALLAEYEASGFGKAQEDARHRIISSTRDQLPSPSCRA